MQSDSTVQIPLRSRDGSVRAYALVDAADADWVNQWRWYLDAAGYARRNERIDGEHHIIRLHRALLGCTYKDGVEVDHIDRDRLNDRRGNLRVVNDAENAQNRTSCRSTSSRFRGVSWHKRDRLWRADVKIGGKQHHIGTFNDEIAAANAVRVARLALLPGAID